MSDKLDVELNIELYKKLYLIRKCESKIIEHYPNDDMKTPMHMSMGSEHISAGVCHALNVNDKVYATFRSHAPFLAKTNNTDLFFTELYGKESSILKGKGGSMHLFEPENNFMCSSAIVGTNIPVALGSAFASKYNNNDNISCTFFGDGSLDEGVFWESLNLASLMKLPVLFILEDNEYAVHTHRNFREGYRSIYNIVSEFDCIVFEKDTTNVRKIYETTKNAIYQIKQQHKPAILIFHYYRYLEHVGINYDFDAGYRDKQIFDMWFSADPVYIQRKNLMLLYNVSNKKIEKIEHEIDNKIEKSLKLAQESSFCSINELCNNVFK